MKSAPQKKTPRGKGLAGEVSARSIDIIHTHHNGDNKGIFDGKGGILKVFLGDSLALLLPLRPQRRTSGAVVVVALAAAHEQRFRGKSPHAAAVGGKHHTAPAHKTNDRYLNQVQARHIAVGPLKKT